ncbi:MAG: cell division protein FtsQ/DivIB [Melioribacteraceae bacterium]|nr:cell division protein FtsQ/DivIB [Melioribacteraceae bacterium]
MSNNLKISSIVTLVSVVALLVYISLSVENDYEINFKSVVVENSLYLDSQEYIKFIRLDNSENFQNLSLTVIKDRIEKHPYINNANISIDDNDKLVIHVFEKEFGALLIGEDFNYIISEGFEVLPKLPFTKNINIPVAVNPKLDNSISEFSSLKKNIDIKTAFKIKEAIKQLNTELSEMLSEIDLRNGKDIMIYFSNFDYPVIIGRDNEISKMVYLKKLWTNLKGSEINEHVDYIDLRFDGQIYLGFSESFLENEGYEI